MKKPAPRTSRYADILAVERTIVDGIHSTDIRVDMGGGDIATADHVADSGDDSCPIPGVDLAIVDEVSGEGNLLAGGYADPNNAPKTAPGEKRIYCRDENGVEVAELWFKRTEMVIEAFAADYPIRIVTTGPVILDSPDVRVSDAAGRPIARQGDLCVGAIRALSAAPGSPIVPIGAVPTPSGGVAFVCKIISGQPKATA